MGAACKEKNRVIEQKLNCISKFKAHRIFSSIYQLLNLSNFGEVKFFFPQKNYPALEFILNVSIFDRILCGEVK